MNYQEFWERFQRAEQAGGAFDVTTLGYQLYPPLRTRLYYQLAQELGIFDDPHPASVQGEMVELEQTPAEIFGSCQELIIPFVRKVGGVDPYAESFIEAMPRARQLEISDAQATLDIERIKTYGAAKFDRVVYELMLKEKVRDVRERWEQMNQAFVNEFGIDLGKFAEFPAWWVRRYISQCMAFKEFFEEIGLKRLWMVNAYSHPAVVVGAKQAGAKVLEIQHGFISNSHPAYSYPKLRIQSAPNRLLVWGDFWKQSARLPKGARAIVTGPSLAFARQRNKAAEVAKQPGSILFTSQGAVGDQLFDEACRWAELLPEQQITFRLHPNESLEHYESKGCPGNLNISHKEPSFLELLATTDFLVGVFSTTLYEGLSFGAKVIVLPISGYENALPAIERGSLQLAPAAPKATELEELLAKAKPPSDAKIYYADKTNAKRGLIAGL
ncbi:MAG: hypothetical protein VWZ99_04675 [Aquiluna sp.]